MSTYIFPLYYFLSNRLGVSIPSTIFATTLSPSSPIQNIVRLRYTLSKSFRPSFKPQTYEMWKQWLGRNVHTYTLMPFLSIFRHHNKNRNWRVSPALFPEKIEISSLFFFGTFFASKNKTFLHFSWTFQTCEHSTISVWPLDFSFPLVWRWAVEVLTTPPFECLATSSTSSFWKKRFF